MFRRFVYPSLSTESHFVSPLRNFHPGRSKPETHSFLIPAESAGIRMDWVLESWLPTIKRSALRTLIMEGSIRLNGRVIRKPKCVSEGDLLQVDGRIDLDALPRFRRKQDSTEKKPEILYEDDSCLVLAKPAGLTVIPDRNNERSLYHFLDEWFKGQELAVVHRLDRGTSGVLLLAKGKVAARELTEQFKERKVSKEYLALIRGNPLADHFVCDAEIGRTIHGGRVRIGRAKGAREAHTTFHVIERFRGFALLGVIPTTGRMHQIRAHLFWSNLPLVIDPNYGGREALFLSEFKLGYRGKRSEKPLLHRLSLHARRLSFRSPASGEVVNCEAETPEDLALTIAKLRRFAPDSKLQDRWSAGGDAEGEGQAE